MNMRYISTIFLIMLLFLSCTNDYPDSLWPPEPGTGLIPEITGISPEGGTFAGVGNIIISGNNFSTLEPVNESNQVVFDNVPAEVISVTATQIEVRSPVLVKDSILVKVWSRGYPDYSDTFVYNLKAAVESISDINSEKDRISAMAVDNDENLYVHVKEEFNTLIKQVKPNGESVEYAKITFIKANGMKFGPDNKLYACITQGRINQIKTVDQAGTEATFATLAALPQDLDFDDQGNIWLVARKSTLDIKPSLLVKVKSDGSSELFDEFEYYFSAVRIFKEGGSTYIYVAGRDGEQQLVWRFPIQGDGTPGTPEVIIDSSTDTWLHGKNILSMTISESGRIYLGTDGSPDGVFVFDQTNQSHEVLYPGLIVPDVLYLTWGNDTFLYASQQRTEIVEEEPAPFSEILKIGLSETSAPYYGRP